MTYALFLRKLLIRTGIARYLPAAQRLTDGGSAFLHYYSDFVLAAPHEELGTAAKLHEQRTPDTIDLALGAPQFDLVPSSSTKLPADRRGWPSSWGMLALREAVAAKLLTDQHLAVSPSDEVLITHGGAGALSIALDTFVNPGHRVVLFDPTSALFPLMLRCRRARLRWIPTWMENGRTRFRLDQLAKALRGARMIMVISPGNPTGGVIAPEDLEQIAWWAQRHDVLIYADEVFERYHYEGQTVSIGTLPQARRRTLTVGSLSKGHALASARVGWLAGHRHLIRPCALTARLHTPFVATVCQQIALTALRLGHEVFTPIHADFESRRRYVFDRLEGLGLKPIWPAGAFFIWLPVKDLGFPGGSFAEKLLQSKKVLVWPGDSFGPSGSGYVRLSYATDDGRLREGLGRMAEWIRDQSELRRAA